MLFQTMQKSVVMLKKCIKLGFKNKTFLVKLEHKGFKFKNLFYISDNCCHSTIDVRLIEVNNKVTCS